MNIGINTVFMNLKPVCDALATNPNKEKLNELQNIVIACPANIVQNLYEYIIFPLYINLEKEDVRVQSSLKQELIDSLKCVVQIVKVNKVKVFLQLCMVVIKQIFNTRTSDLHSSADEELKLSAIQCLNALFKRVSPDILCELYVKNNTIYFPQCIYLCTQIAKNEKMRHLRFCAIECLTTIFYLHEDANLTDKILRKQVADATMFFLPGVTIALRDVALGDEKQGHKTTTSALNALKKIIVLHMEDEEFDKDEKELIIQFPTPKDVNDEEITKETDTISIKVDEEKSMKADEVKKKENVMNRFKIETRSKDWFNTSGENLGKLTGTLIPLQNHYHEKVRYGLSEFCEEIILNCSGNLESCIIHCIEMLISLSEDNNSMVSQRSKEALTRINKTSINFTHFEILAQNFFNMLTKLPRILNGTDVQQQESVLNMFVGYLRLLGSTNLVQILQSTGHLKRLLQSLILISQLEKSTISLFEEHAIRGFESIPESSLKWKHFKYLEDKLLFTKLQTALQLLSQSEAFEILVDSLTDLYINDYEFRNEVIFLLNELLSVKVDEPENRLGVISDVLSLYTEEENWYLSTDTKELTLAEVHNNIVQMCLLVDGIGCMSHCLGTHFKSFLLKTLYIILERAGSAQPLLSTAGLSSLLQITKACHYSTVTDLIVKNTDYFSFHVIKRLKRLHTDTGVLNVLNVVMKYSTVDVLPSVMNIINEVVLYSCDKFQESNATAFLRVFYSFVQNLRRWMNINEKNEDKIVQLLSEYKKNMDILYAMYTEPSSFAGEATNKSVEEMYQEDMMKREEELEMEENESKKEELPEHIKLTVLVLKRSLNFLPSKNQDRKLLVINILIEGVQIINQWENELLPLVHLIWSPLTDRFKTEVENPLVINRSFVLLCTLAKYSKDFIRARTSKNVLPEIYNNLIKGADKSYLKDKGSAYRYTQEYKWQLIILSDLAQLVTDLEMSTKDVEEIMKGVKPYLSSRQPRPLQEKAVAFYKTLALYDFDSVWLFLINVWGNGSTEEDTKDQELKKNVEHLLKVLEVLHW